MKEVVYKFIDQVINDIDRQSGDDGFLLDRRRADIAGYYNQGYGALDVSVNLKVISINEKMELLGKMEAAKIRALSDINKY